MPFSFSSLIRPGLLAALLVGAAQAISFGGLTVTPRGPQTLNLETGATDLPQGGSATDSRGGLKLSAQSMQLRPGSSLLARGATITTRQGGTLKAAQVVYDLKAGTVTATGDVSYNDARLKNLSAPRLVLHVGSGFVTASGGVKASAPALSGAVLAFDLSTMQGVLTGPYVVRQGTLNASGGAGDRLLMVFGGNRVLRSSTDPDADSLARFLPYLK